MLILALLACSTCGRTVFANTGLEWTVDEETSSLDTSGGELCGAGMGTWGFTLEESLSNWPESRSFELTLSPDVPSNLASWEINLSMPWDKVRSGESLSFEDGELTGSPCYLTYDGCEAGLAMSAGQVSFHDFWMDDDPCDPLATISLDMSWDVSFGEVGGQEYWVSSTGSDEVPIFIDFLCGSP